MNARPLVAHVIHRLDVGGMENGLVNLLNRTPRDRYRHAVVSLTDATEFRERIEGDDVPILSLGKRPGQDLGLHVRLYRAFRELSPSIVHTRNLSAVEAMVAASFARVPCRVHGEHGRDMHDLDGRRMKYRLLRKALSPLIHRFIALSRDLEKYLIEKVGVSPSKVSRIVNGVDVEKFRPATLDKAPGPVVIGGITRMQEVKDPLTLARAFVRLIKRGSPVRLLLVGDGPLLSDVRRILEDGGAMPHAKLVGGRDDVAELLREMDVFALSSRVEGISNTILEAMATGLPVVATRVGGNSELVAEGATGTLVAPRDPEALAYALSRYVEHPRLRREHGMKARVRTEHEFALGGMVERYLSLYDEVLAARNVTTYTKMEKESSLRCAE